MKRSKVFFWLSIISTVVVSGVKNGTDASAAVTLTPIESRVVRMDKHHFPKMRDRYFVNLWSDGGVTIVREYGSRTEFHELILHERGFTDIVGARPDIVNIESRPLHSAIGVAVESQAFPPGSGVLPFSSFLKTKVHEPKVWRVTIHYSGGNEAIEKVYQRLGMKFVQIDGTDSKKVVGVGIFEKIK